MGSSLSPPRKDATIRVPLAYGGLARAVTPEGPPLDTRQMLSIALSENERLNAELAGVRRDLADAKRDLRMLGDSASAISSVALSLTRMLLDKGEAKGRDEVVIPKKLHARMLGASIRLGHDPDGSVRVALRDEGRERVVPG